MIVLGLNGGISMPYENIPIFGPGESHDSAAALLINGEIVSAIEEERISRIKHTNKFPINAIKAVLDEQKIGLEDIDYFAYYASEESVEAVFKKYYYTDASHQNILSPRECIAQLFKKSFDFEIDKEKICFVDHHLAHASSSFYLSGFEESLVMTIDGVGDNISGRILYGSGGQMKGIDSISELNSLGQYYVAVSKFTGYDLFDEYKVMGLAPYGDPSKYRDVFSLFYKLLPNGKFEIHRDYIRTILFNIGKPRRKGEPFSQLYRDVAAALQESVEKIILHILKYHREKSGYDKLCLSGGVAHNCSANGKIYYSGLFKEIFIQPASHDAGNSVGSAIYTYLQKSKESKVKKLEHVFLGTPVESGSELSKLLHRWDSFLDFREDPNIEETAAQLLADGKILGWVQGKSEFGPRALGNRSIIADPRPEKHKDIVNRMVKKREAYRPFAPSVLKEKAQEYFDINSNGTCFDYMTFVVNVKEAYRKKLGAITHVDGTARVQTVDKAFNPKYWNLINEFGKRTGVSMILNTSFNNNVEPIINTAEDAIVCFLTTGLHYLVIGDFLISKKHQDHTKVLSELVPRLPHHTILSSEHAFDSFRTKSVKYEIGFNYTAKYNREVSKEVFDLISDIDGERSINELLSKHYKSNGESKTRLLQEIDELWRLRFISLSPCYQLVKA